MEVNLVSNGEDSNNSDDLGVAYVDLKTENNAVKRTARCKFTDLVTVVLESHNLRRHK